MKIIALITVFASTLSSSAFADNSACGNISHISLPSYTLQVKGDDGSVLPQVPASVKLSMGEPIWSGDHWTYKDASINLSITYNASSATYQTQAMEVKVPSHWKGLFGPDCLDKVNAFNVTFNFFPKTDSQYDITRAHQNFSYTFPDSGDVQLPDASKTQVVTLASLQAITGVFEDNTHIVDSSGKSTLVTYFGTPGGGDPDDVISDYVTEDEIHKILYSLSTSTNVTVYGQPTSQAFLISNVALK